MATLGNVLPADILRMQTRNTVRAPINPLDRCTIVSIFPKYIKERKATIQPGVFEIGKGTIEKPSLLVVGPSSWWKNVDIDDTPQPLLEIPVSSPTIAEAFIKDYCNGLVGNAPDSGPGLFFLLGDLTKKDKKTGEVLYDETIEFLKSEYSESFEKAAVRQKLWYERLIYLADALWSNSNNNPLAVSEDMRLAASELNISGKDWMSNRVISTSVNCVACGQLRNPEYPVCSHCHAVVDKARAEALGIVFAK